jgi:hypothetical protein
MLFSTIEHFRTLFTTPGLQIKGESRSRLLPPLGLGSNRDLDDSIGSLLEELIGIYDVV